MVLEYLPTFELKNHPNVGKYIYHTWSIWVCFWMLLGPSIRKSVTFAIAKYSNCHYKVTRLPSKRKQDISYVFSKMPQIPRFHRNDKEQLKLKSISLHRAPNQLPIPCLMQIFGSNFTITMSGRKAGSTSTCCRLVNSLCLILFWQYTEGFDH